LIDLFGAEVTTEYRGHSKTLKHRALLAYRKAEGKERCCKTCVHLHGHEHVRRYYKCSRLGETCGPATDIRLSYVCNGWEKG